MTRAAIYSRYSSELQNPKSIEHQEAEARAFAAREGLEVVAAYSDSAASGSSTIGRAGLLQMIQDARAGAFEVLLVEELDRLSRDMGDLSEIHKQMKYARVQIRSLHGGVANTMTVGLRGLIGQMYLEDLAVKTRRGQRGRVNDGFLAAGAAYGYRANPAERGRPTIDPDQADVVRRIFQDFDQGATPRQIAAGLNAEHVPTPRGNLWMASALYGWSKRGTGILRNRLYNGEIVWNRTTFSKDPDTGRRISSLNNASEYVIKAAEEFRIVDPALFARVQARLADAATPKVTPAVRSPKRLLSGLLVCGACGGGLSILGADKSGRVRLCCTRHREAKACPDPHVFYADIVEQTVVDVLRRELTDPDVLVAYVKAYNEARIELARDMTRRRATLERRVQDLDGECDRLLQLLTKGIGNADRISMQLTERETELEAARAELSREGAHVDIAVLHPAVIRRYAEQLKALQAVLASDTKKAAPAFGAALRELVDNVTVYARPPAPGAKGQDHAKQSIEVKIVGKLRKFLDLPAAGEKVVGTVGCGSWIWSNPTTFEPLYELRACA